MTSLSHSVLVRKHRTRRAGILAGALGGVALVIALLVAVPIGAIAAKGDAPAHSPEH